MCSCLSIQIAFYGFTFFFYKEQGFVKQKQLMNPQLLKTISSKSKSFSSSTILIKITMKTSEIIPVILPLLIALSDSSTFHKSFSRARLPWIIQRYVIYCTWLQIPFWIYCVSPLQTVPHYLTLFNLSLRHATQFVISLTEQIYKIKCLFVMLGMQ